MSDFGDGRTVVARKQYSCEWCHTPIVVGEPHFRFSGKWQGDFQDWRMHSDCEDAHQEETYEGEICDEDHQRGRTCSDKRDERRKLAKEIAEKLIQAVGKGVPGWVAWVSLADEIIGDVKEWEYAEQCRVDEARKAALAKAEARK